jgi:hypothetical protein
LCGARPLGAARAAVSCSVTTSASETEFMISPSVGLEFLGSPSLG